MQEVISLSDYFRFIFALAIVIGLILLCAVFLRRIKSANFSYINNKNRRIAVVDNIPLDAKHQLILIKRDNVEHLVILGMTSDILIEQNITPPEIPVTDLKNKIENNNINKDTANLTKSKISNNFKKIIKQMKHK